MRIFVVALAIVMLAMPAHAQMGAGAGKPADRAPPPPPPDERQKKKDEKAFNDAVSRIPAPDKKYDPWGVVRGNGNR
jgi:hypothetical protein